MKKTLLILTLGLFAFSSCKKEEDDTTPQNNAPVAVDDTKTEVNVLTANIEVLSNDSDADNDPLTVIKVLNVTSGGTATILENNTIDFTGQSYKTYTFDYVLSDGTDTDTAQVTVNLDYVFIGIEK